MSELPDLSRRVLAAVVASPQAISGRRVATVAGASPTKVNSTLSALERVGAVTFTTAGAARLWSATTVGRDLLGTVVERDVVWLCALPLEYTAARERLGAGAERRAPSGARYCEAQLIGEHVRWRIRLFESGMGNPAAAAALSRAAQDFPPDLVIFSGVAGGLRGSEQHLGEVIVVDSAYSGSSGKAFANSDGSSAFQGRPKSLPSPEKLLSLARSIVRTPELLPGSFLVSVADLVSTERVEADPNGDFAQRMKRELGTVRAVDMESYGTYVAARALGIPAIAVRGLSDLDGVKQAESDADWQPVAAANAASVAAVLLDLAHPDDLPPKSLGPSPTQAPDGGNDAGGGRPIPPYTARWLSELGTSSAWAETAAREDLSSTDSTPRTSASVRITHPPAWVRQEKTGAGWAALATLADAVGSASARTAWAHAQAVASANDDPVAATLFALNVARSHHGSDITDEDIDAIHAAIAAVDLSAAPELEPVFAFWSGLPTSDSPRVDEATLLNAGAALAALGHADLLPGLSLGSVTAPAVVAPARLPLAVEHATNNILLAVTYYMLSRDDFRAGLWAEAEMKLAPWSTEARLRHLQTRMQALHKSLRLGSADSVTSVLSQIERDALAVRQDRLGWGGDTAEALALAARARVERDDAAGALKLLRAAPAGIARDEEAGSPMVLAMAATAALLSGDTALAAELADQVEPEIERQLLRAATFSQTKSTHDLARQAYREALGLSRNAYHLERSLGGLARLRVPVLDDVQLRTHLEQLRALDEQAADLVSAEVELLAGEPGKSLLLSKRYRSLHAVQLQSEALSASGRNADAVGVLDDYGIGTGDLTIRMQALELAGRSSLWELARPLADAIISAAGDGPLRHAARRARASIAAQARQWHEVELQFRAMATESPDAGGDGGHGYAWPIAEAMFYQGRFADALAQLRSSAEPWQGARGALDSPTTDPQKVRLTLAILHRLLPEQSQLIDDKVVDWVLAVGSSMLNHEDVSASAIALLMQLPREISDQKVLAARQLFDRYFATYGDTGAIRQLDVSPTTGDPDGEPNLQPLIDELRNSLQPSSRVRADIATRVANGELPTGFLAVAARRSYAEILISQPAGQFLARPAVRTGRHWVEPGAVQAARDALASGQVVIDTSALVLVDQVADRRAVIAAFDTVFLPRSLREDIANARTKFAFRSTSSLGWNETADRPVLVEIDIAEVEEWARRSVALDEVVALLSLIEDAPTIGGDAQAVDSDTDQPTIMLPTTAWQTANHLGHALWVDDAVLLRLAHAHGLPAFGTPELLAALRESAAVDTPSDLQLLSRLRELRVLDLPIPTNWEIEARAAQWELSSYLRLAVSRPNAWQDIPASFARYQRLIRALPSEPHTSDRPAIELVAGWCEAAAWGLGRAVPPSGRHVAIGALIAWTALNSEPALNPALVTVTAQLGVAPGDIETATTAPMLQALLGVALRAQQGLFPQGDGVRAVITALADTLRAASDGATAAAVLARAVHLLPPELSELAFSALWRAPKPT